MTFYFQVFASHDDDTMCFVIGEQGALRRLSCFSEYFSACTSLALNVLTVTLAFTALCYIGRVMILGSGWGGFKLLRDMNKDSYQVVAVSPR